MNPRGFESGLEGKPSAQEELRALYEGLLAANGMKHSPESEFRFVAESPELVGPAIRFFLDGYHVWLRQADRLDSEQAFVSYLAWGSSGARKS